MGTMLAPRDAVRTLRRSESRFESCRECQFDIILDFKYDDSIMSNSKFFVPDSWEAVQHEALTEEGSTPFVEFILGDDENEVRFCIANEELDDLKEFIGSLLGGERQVEPTGL